MTDECVFVVKSQWVGMVAKALVGAYDEPFRFAQEGEAQTPALFEESRCDEHCGQTMTTWRRVDTERIPAVERALSAGCDGLCSCVCEHRVLTEAAP